MEFIILVDEGMSEVCGCDVFVSDCVAEVSSSPSPSASSSPSSGSGSFESSGSEGLFPPEEPDEPPPLGGQRIPKHGGALGPPPGHGNPPQRGVQWTPPGPTMTVKDVGTIMPAEFEQSADVVIMVIPVKLARSL